MVAKLKNHYTSLSEKLILQPSLSPQLIADELSFSGDACVQQLAGILCSFHILLLAQWAVFERYSMFAANFSLTSGWINVTGLIERIVG
jgi:hypothetical protein